LNGANSVDFENKKKQIDLFSFRNFTSDYPYLFEPVFVAQTSFRKESFGLVYWETERSRRSKLDSNILLQMFEEFYGVKLHGSWMKDGQKWYAMESC